MKKAVIVTFDKFTDIDMFLPWDLLNRVKLRHPDFEVKFVGTAASHTSSAGLKLDMHGLIEEANDADMVFFGSGYGARVVSKDEAFLERFNLDPSKQIICSMCSGALIIAALGHLKGLSATTYPTAFEALKSYGVDVIEDTHLVTHGNIGTAAGCLAAVDLIGWAIEKMYNGKTRQDVIASVLPIGQGQVCMY
ncbi:thiamine biosynthesis protein ThiJ [Mucilaginibacter sp. PPCGB 2223]|uniref:DJ-1/PfpI family protein n=1 Tax=Mucilaginibacter sp. PPCGB 2223 TaxID=1886027 RepID=UPI0008256D47|nr:DJ-1/PfpI family protein [Mucilaginibacter sp. PPCGB 2223]OCX51013.1 thiamine biosynthesis protein ThiJ [Mucilaginibacter sp. PPCGB 2223]